MTAHAFVSSTRMEASGITVLGVGVWSCQFWVGFPSFCCGSNTCLYSRLRNENALWVSMDREDGDGLRGMS